LKLNDVGLVHKNQQVIGISQFFLQYHAFIKKEEEEVVKLTIFMWSYDYFFSMKQGRGIYNLFHGIGKKE
jgi:hypothetical protein